VYSRSKGIIGAHLNFSGEVVNFSEKYCVLSSEVAYNSRHLAVAKQSYIQDLIKLSQASYITILILLHQGL
jgi:hypothetical protein